MKFVHSHQLVLQFPANSLSDYDALIELEEQIITGIGNLGEVDGHDMGVGEMNIFIHTDNPQVAFEKLRLFLATKDSTSEYKAAYREIGGNDFKVIHPKNCDNFTIA